MYVNAADRGAKDTEEEFDQTEGEGIQAKADREIGDRNIETEKLKAGK